MGILLPCDLSTWPSVVSYLNVLTSGLDSIQDVIVVLLQIHDLCNISIFNDEEDARYGKYQLWSFKLGMYFYKFLIHKSSLNQKPVYFGTYYISSKHFFLLR